MGDFAAAPADVPERFAWLDEGVRDSPAPAWFEVATPPAPPVAAAAPSSGQAAPHDVIGTLVSLVLVPLIGLAQLTWLYWLYSLVRGVTGS
jgi:hypothetical protein